MPNPSPTPLSPTRPYPALLGPTRPYSALLGPTRPYSALLGPTRPEPAATRWACLGSFKGSTSSCAERHCGSLCLRLPSGFGVGGIGGSYVYVYICICVILYKHTRSHTCLRQTWTHVELAPCSGALESVEKVRLVRLYSTGSCEDVSPHSIQSRGHVAQFGVSCSQSHG